MPDPADTTAPNPAPPWVAEGRCATAAELERHIAAMRPSERIVILDSLLRQAQAGAECDAMDHHGQLAALFHNGATLIAAAARYRDAWASARRRAQHLREVLGFVDDVPIDLAPVDVVPPELHLDEERGTVSWVTPTGTSTIVDVSPSAALLAHPHNTDLIATSSVTGEYLNDYWPCGVDPTYAHTAGPCPHVGTYTTQPTKSTP